MSTASIAIDNFLDSDKWNTIQSGISSYLNVDTYTNIGDPLRSQIEGWIEEKLRSLNLWQEPWKDEIKLFHGINVLPEGINVESSDPTNGGYHREDGGYIYYIHPAWTSSWGGNLKLKNCSVAQIEPKPNRFVWVNPDIWHGVEVVNNTASTNRISVVAWPSGTVEYSDADLIINTST